MKLTLNKKWNESIVFIFADESIANIYEKALFFI